jgi:hypothetical protein
MADGGSSCTEFLGQYRAISNKLKKYVKQMGNFMWLIVVRACGVVDVSLCHLEVKFKTTFVFQAISQETECD